MMGKALVIVALFFGVASQAMAASSPSPSRSPVPAPSRPQPTDYELGVKAVKAKDWSRALALLQKVVQGEPRNADAWNYLGYSYRHLKQFDRSLAAYQEALAINPNHRGANEYLGELYLQIGDPEKARERLEKLRALCPSGCSEYDDLAKAIKAYESTRKSG